MRIKAKLGHLDRIRLPPYHITVWGDLAVAQHANVTATIRK